MKNYFTQICALGLILGLVSVAQADKRGYVWTYEYMTMLEGKAELEYYVTTEIVDQNQPEVNTWKHWVELEYGITDRWDISLYQMWRQENGSAVSGYAYDGFKIRSRYRFGEKGQLFIDPLVYLEYKRSDDLSAPGVGEAKLILAKDFGRLNISYNQVIEAALDSHAEIEHAYAAGFRYALGPQFSAGIEAKGGYSDGAHHLGPTLSWSKPMKFYVSFGLLFGVNNDSKDVQSRFIAGFLI